MTRSVFRRLPGAATTVLFLLLPLGCAPRDQSGELVLAGALEARTVEVGSLVGGRVTQVMVDEGAEVEAGTLLVALDSDLIDRQIEGQEARIEEGEARLALALAGPRSEARQRARIEWEAAKTDLARIEALFSEGVVDRQNFDRATVREATTHESWLEASRGSRSEEIAAARAVVDGARADLAYLQRQRRELEVHAPVGGRIESFDLRPGDLVAAGRPVAVLLERGELWVRVYVPEPSLGRVRVGQRARLRVDTFPDRDFAAEVVEIRHRAEYLPRNVQTLDQRSDQVFAVKVRLDRSDDLRPGMAAFVTLAGSDTGAGE